MAKPYLRPESKTWYVRHGSEKIKVGKSKKAAEHLADKINVETSEGRVGIYKAKGKNIKVFFEEVIEYKKNINSLKPLSVYRYKSVVKTFCQFLEQKFPGTIYLSQLNQTTFEKYIHYRKTTPLKKSEPSKKPEQLKNKKSSNLQQCARDRTVKLEIKTLRALLNLTVKSKDPEKRYLLENPLDYIEPIKANDEITKRPLTKEEARQFLSYLQETDKHLYEIFFTFIHTGMRDGELRHLEWNDVDLKNRVIMLREKKLINEKTGQEELWTPKTKNGKREIPMHDDLYKILEKRKSEQKDKNNFVFPDPKTGGVLKTKLRRKLIQTMKAIGINDFTRVHDLRRTFISFMAMAGVPRETTMDMVGHVDEQTYELYRESTRKHRLESVNKLDFGVDVS